MSPIGLSSIGHAFCLQMTTGNGGTMELIRL